MEQWRRLPIQALVLATPAPMFWSITKAFFLNQHMGLFSRNSRKVIFWDALFDTPAPMYWGIDAFFFVN